MAWTEVSLSVPVDDAALAQWVLEQSGALAVTLEDDQDSPLLEPAVGTTPLWPRVLLRGLFEDSVERAGIHAALQAVPGAGKPEQIRWRAVADDDWERAWMDRFAPMQFGRRLWIVPSGMEIPSDPDNVELHLDPGLAFGTGTHPTTALCLEWLDGRPLEGLTVVDYGCGSGVLGIAAALKGARKIVSVDHDRQALAATRENARRNGVLERIRVFEPQDYRPRPVDLVLANILAEPLISLAPVLLASLSKGGDLVLCGLLEEQADRVVRVYRPELDGIERENRDGWVRLHGRKS
jgi:ribosomal protein L11 methyltransferase